jgi:acyl carrier protein
MTTIDERLKKIIVKQLSVDEREVTSNASFVENLHADSLDLVELMMAMEEEFEIDISPEEMELLTTVKDAREYLEQHV